MVQLSLLVARGRLFVNFVEGDELYQVDRSSEARLAEILLDNKNVILIGDSEVKLIDGNKDDSLNYENEIVNQGVDDSRSVEGLRFEGMVGDEKGSLRSEGTGGDEKDPKDVAINKDTQISGVNKVLGLETTVIFPLWWAVCGEVPIDGYCSKIQNLNMNVESYRAISGDITSEVIEKGQYFCSAMWDDEEDTFFKSRLGLAGQYFALPLGKKTLLSVTTADVMHSWGVPSLGVKIDAIPGRINTFIVKPEVPGVFIGQCYELCGRFHRLIPINVNVINVWDYEAYLTLLALKE